MIEKPLKVFDLLDIPETQVDKYSVRLNGKLFGYDVMDAYRNHKSELLDHAHTIVFGGSGWYIHTPYVLQFVELGWNEWLFIGLSEIAGDPTELRNGNVLAGYRMLDRYSAFEGRLVARFDKTSNAQGRAKLTRNLSKPRVREYVTQHLVVDRIARSAISAEPFPGYNQLRLNHPELVSAVRNQGWEAALGSVSAVYLLTDMSNGWHYVGSAYSLGGESKGLLSRWREYASGDYHGDNKWLRRLTREHIERYFQYSVLEVFDPSTDPQKIIQREHWWIDTLGSAYSQDHPFGYN